MIPQIHPIYDEDVALDIRKYLIEDRGWITEGKVTRDFEAKLAELKGAAYCRVVANGTTALSISLRALELPERSGILVPAYTMAGSVAAIIEAGHIPQFCDVEPDTWCLDANSLEETISPTTRAIMIVSMNGRYPRNSRALISLSEKYGLTIIEDGAQSLASHYGTHPFHEGSILCTTSFSMPKIITTGNGGAIFTNDEALNKKICLYTDFGRIERGTDIYEVAAGNGKFSDLQAVFGLNQLKDFNNRKAGKKRILESYSKAIDRNDHVYINKNRDNEIPMFVELVLAESRFRSPLKQCLHDNGIGTRDVYPNLAKSKAFHKYGTGKDFPITDRIAERGLWLPSAHTLKDDEINFISNIVLDFMQKKLGTF